MGKQYGVRNQFAGEVIQIKTNDIMSEVVIETGENSYVTSVMTTDSLKAMKIKEGDLVKALVKAVNVVLVKE